MKYQVSGESWAEDFQVEMDPAGKDWSVTLPDGSCRSLRVESVEPGGGVLRFEVDGVQHSLTILPAARPGEAMRFILDDEYHELTVHDPVDLLAQVLGDSAGATGSEQLYSVMPGIIRQLLVAPGDTVEEGQPLLILEAMKMENEIVAPRAGIVEHLAVSSGQTVATGDLLGIIGESS